jgi:tetratricopeptide (TPR) repeat protein
MRGLLCTLALAAGAPLSAAEPGEAETPAADAASPAAGVPAAYEYETEIQRLEADRGAYDPQLGEQLLSLGLVYQSQEQHGDAVKALKRAMYIRRVNAGLYDMGQVPILNEIIQSDIASQDWEDLDQAYEQLLFIHRRNFEPGDPRFLPILDTVGAWKVRAYTEELLKENPTATINSAERLYRDNVRILEKQYGETDPRLIEPLYGRAVVGYQLLREVASRPLSDFSRSAPIAPPVVQYQRVCAVVAGRVVCQLVPISTGSSYLSQYARQQQDKDMEIQRYVTIINESLKQTVEIHEAHPELPAESRARALIHMGDWNMIRGRRNTAVDFYKRAYDTLAVDAEGDALVEKYFGTPKSIPTLRLPVPHVDQKLEQLAEQSYVTVAVDITKRGDARNFQVVEQANPADEGAVRKARDKIKEGRFRPRFENGEPVDTPGFRLKVTDMTE